MKLYRVSYQTADVGMPWVWASSMKEARRLAKECEENSGEYFLEGSIAIDRMEVPTDKAGLIQFLNSYACDGNG